MQETLVKALANLDHFEEGTKLKSWLFTIMRNAFCTRFAASRREAPLAAECVADMRTSEATQEWRIFAQDIARVYADMPSYYRAAIEVVVIQGRSYEDAASDLNCAVGTIKSRLNRARQYLTERFGDLYL